MRGAQGKIALRGKYKGKEVRPRDWEDFGEIWERLGKIWEALWFTLRLNVWTPNPAKLPRSSAAG